MHVHMHIRIRIHARMHKCAYILTRIPTHKHTNIKIHKCMNKHFNNQAKAYNLTFLIHILVHVIYSRTFILMYKFSVCHYHQSWVILSMYWFQYIHYDVDPSAGPVDLKVARFRSSSVTLVWGPPPCENHNGDITGYQVVIQKEDGKFLRRYLPVYKRNLSQITIECEGMQLNRYYTFSVAAVNNAGTGVYSSYPFFTNEGRIP